MCVVKLYLVFYIFIIGVIFPNYSYCSEKNEEDFSEQSNLNVEDKESFNAILSQAQLWVKQQEEKFSHSGRQLSIQEFFMAKAMGVQYPEQVRVVVIADFPIPTQQPLLNEYKNIGFTSPEVGGQAFGYTILIKPRYAGKDWLLLHELVHVAQFERIGIKRFVARYLTELKTLGYRDSLIEIEAREKSQSYISG